MSNTQISVLELISQVLELDLSQRPSIEINGRLVTIAGATPADAQSLTDFVDSLNLKGLRVRINIASRTHYENF